MMFGFFGDHVKAFAGALTLASVLLYPKTLGGGAVFSGWVPFNSSMLEQIPPEAKRVLEYAHYTFLALKCVVSNLCLELWSS